LTRFAVAASILAFPFFGTFGRHVQLCPSQSRRPVPAEWPEPPGIIAAILMLGGARLLDARLLPLEGIGVETYALLFLATVVAGAVNAVGGGGGLITFPLLLTVVSPVNADATSSFALLPGYATSTWVCRQSLAPVRPLVVAALGPSLLGGLLGALLLGLSGERPS